MDELPGLDALAATKFTPPRIPVGWVDRPRLHAALDAGLARPLTLLAASPGSGKTALLGAWHEQRTGSGRVAWLSLDSADRDPRRFWRGVLTALARAGAPDAIASLALHPGDGIDHVVPALVNVFDRVTEPVVLVLDDFHEVGDGGVAGHLDRLLRHPPPALRIVISTRIDPPLRLGRLRISGELAEIREADLAFTRDESAALLAAAGVGLEDAQVARLWRRTEGWAAGLRLASLTLRTHPHPARFVEAFAGDDAAMADYLLAEVLDQLPDELVDFLLRTSVVDHISAELAEALTGRADSARVLARLEREHALVIALGDDRPWHRYHPLLLELLRSQLRFRMPAEVPELHRRAAVWYRDRCRPVDALRHAAAAGDRNTVAVLAGENWVPLLVRGELDTLRSVLAELPADPVERDPEVSLALAAVLLDGGDEPGAGRHFAFARTRRSEVPSDRRARFDLGLAAVGLIRARLRGDLDVALGHARALLGEHETAPDAAAVALDLRALALLNLGIAELWTGELENAQRDLDGARRAAEAGKRDWMVLLAVAHLAVHGVMVGRLERARRLAEQTLALAGQRGWDRAWPVGVAEGVLSVVALERNRLMEADAHFVRGRALLANASDAPLRMAVRLQHARLLEARGEFEPALEALDAAREIGGDWPVMSGLSGLRSGLRARLHAAQGRSEAALVAINREDGRPATAEDAAALAAVRLQADEPDLARAALAPWLEHPSGAFGSLRAELWLLDAVACDAEADHSAAAASLERSLDAAEPGGARRPFVALGVAAGPLLRRKLRQGTAHRSLVEDLLRELEPPARGGARGASGADGLSDRETAVLRFLPTMMSNQEIASELFVSVNTVKTHLKSIYRKLDVTDRRDAIRRARELELLAP